MVNVYSALRSLQDDPGQDQELISEVMDLWLQRQSYQYFDAPQCKELALKKKFIKPEIQGFFDKFLSKNYPEKIRPIIFNDQEKNNEIIIIKKGDKLPEPFLSKSVSRNAPTVFHKFLRDLSDKFGVPCPELILSEGPLSGLIFYLEETRTGFISVSAPYNALSTKAIKGIIAHEFFHYLQRRSGLVLEQYEGEYLADGFGASATSKAALEEFYDYTETVPEINQKDSARHPAFSKRRNFVQSLPETDPLVYWQDVVSASKSRSYLSVASSFQ